MRVHQLKIEKKIEQVCRQWKQTIMLKGSAQLLIVAGLSSLIAFGLDNLLALDSDFRWLLLGFIVISCLTVLYKKIIWPLLNIPTRPQIARFLEEKYPHLEDRLVTSVELGSVHSGPSQTFLKKLLEDTRFHVEPINVSASFKSKSTAIWSFSALALCLILVSLFFTNLEYVSMHAGRLLTPWRFPTIKPKTALSVEPGNIRVQRASPQQIVAEITGFEADNVTLYFAANDSVWNKVEMDPTNKDQIFVYNLFDLQQDTKYYATANENISEIYQLTVYDAPKIKRVDLSYKFPKYTGLAPKEEKDAGDIWAPVGTIVTITATADKPLESAKIVLGNNEMLKTTVQDSVITAKVTLTKDDYYKIQVKDADALTNDPVPEYYIHALPDQPPVLTMERPARDIRASMLEEIPVRLSVRDDYGRPQVKLKYVVNGSSEKELNLDLKRNSGESSSTAGGVQSFSGGYLFYLEDLKVKPGDFVGYYFEAKNSNNAGKTVNSEIYFIEIRPFETEFSRPLSQEQMAGGGNGAARLSQTQKEILIATWKTQQKKDVLDNERFSENVKVLAESQQNLKEVTEGALFQLKQRTFLTTDVNSDVTRFYEEAVESMQKAVLQLDTSDLKEAQVAQRGALQSLLQAEAQIREVQIQRAQGQSGGSNASLNELAQLFDEEMDKLNNKYETLNQAQQNQGEEELNDALQKVKDLAKRQQQFNRQIRDLTRNDLKPEEKKRKIEELRREQERIRREAQELASKMQQMEQQNSNLPRQVQENLKTATSEMNNASHNLGSDNTELAAAKGTRALDRLNKLEDLLKRNQKESLRRQVNELEQQFQELAKNQRSLTKDVEQLAQNKDESGEFEEMLASTQRRQKNLLEDIQRTQEQIESLNKQSRLENNPESREIQKATQQITSEELGIKTREAQRLLDEKKLNSATQANRDILARLERSAEEMTKVRSGLAETKEEKLDLALKQTRRLREEFESLQRQTGKLGEQPGKGDEDNQQGEQTAFNKQAGPSESKGQPQQLDPLQMDWMNDELAKSLNDLETLQQSLMADTSLTQTAQNLNQALGGILKSFGGGLPERMSMIEQKVLIPLKGLEAELAQKLELLRNREKLFLAREERVPKGYELLVEKYYEALSKTDK